MTVILWQKINGPTWEADYIKYDLLQNKYKETVEFEEKDIYVYTPKEISMYKHCIIVFNKESYSYIINYLKKLKPSIIIYTSNEIGKFPDFLDYANYTKLFLYNYHHEYKNRKYPSNVVQFPLGYAKKYLHNIDSVKLIDSYLDNKNDMSIIIKPINERKYNFSFIGDATKNQERKTMAKAVDKLGIFMGRGNYIQSNQTDWRNMNELAIKPCEMYTIYNDTIFIITGRGYHRLDTFRIYECILAGAIPVIIGEPNEINTTFKYNGNLLKALYYTSINEAIVECKKLLADPDKLQEKQIEVLNWWKKNMQRIRAKITVALDNNHISKTGGVVYNHMSVIIYVFIICLVYLVFIFQIIKKNIKCHEKLIYHRFF